MESPSPHISGGGKRSISFETRFHIVRTVADALQYFERTFGPYPLDELTVVTVPREFSQSYLGFVTLMQSLVTHPDPNGEAARWMQRTTISHELADQAAEPVHACVHGLVPGVAEAQADEIPVAVASGEHGAGHDGDIMLQGLLEQFSGVYATR